MAKKLSRNGLLMLIGGELMNHRVVPFNPMDITEIARRAHLADRRNRQLAAVVQAMVPSADYGGMDDAREEWAAYMAEFHPEQEAP